MKDDDDDREWREFNSEHLLAELESLERRDGVRQRDREQAAQVGTGQAGLVRLRGNIWRLHFRSDRRNAKGRRKQHSVRLGDRREGMTYEQARSAAALRIEQLRPRQIPPDSTCPWPAWCELYRTMYLPNLSPPSRDTLSSILRRHLEPAFHSLYVHEIGNRRIQTWIAAMRRAGASAETIRGRYRLLRRVLGRARAQGLAVTLPLAGDIDLPRLEVTRTIARGANGRAFTEDELARILEAADARAPWLGTLCRVLAFVGLRRSEALALQWGDIDFARKRVQIVRQVIGKREAPAKTTSSVAERPIPPRLLAHLACYRASQPADGPLLFPSPRGGMRDAGGVGRRQLRPLLARLGIQGRLFHGFRHFLGSSGVRSGLQLPTVQRLLRHADARSTARYVEVDAGELDAAIARVESLYLESRANLLSAPDERNEANVANRESEQPLAE